MDLRSRLADGRERLNRRDRGDAWFHLVLALPFCGLSYFLANALAQDLDWIGSRRDEGVLRFHFREPLN